MSQFIELCKKTKGHMTYKSTTKILNDVYSGETLNVYDYGSATDILNVIHDEENSALKVNLIGGGGGGATPIGIDGSIQYNIGGALSGSSSLYYDESNGILNLTDGKFDVKYGTGSVYIGDDSGKVDDSGNQNVGIGVNSLLSNTSGDRNTAIGYECMRTQINGNDNVSIGYNSSRTLRGSENTIIGSSAQNGGQYNTNEIVIGYNTTGIGSNTAVIGNDDITKTRLKGNLELKDLVDGDYSDIFVSGGTIHVNEVLGVFAYLCTGNTQNTTITTAGTYYRVEGDFINDPIEGFIISGDTLTYKGEKDVYFEIDWHASIQANQTTSLLTMAISKNGSVVCASRMNLQFNTLSSDSQAAGTLVIKLSKDDTIELVCTSDDDGDSYLFDSFTTTIKRFF